MNQPEDYKYPVPKETLHKYAESIFKPIIRGECVTTVWVPMAGRRMWNKFIIENIHLFEKELPNFEKYLLVYIEPLDLTEESLAGYLRLMAKSFLDVAKKNKESAKRIKNEDFEVLDNPNTTYSSLLNMIKELLKQATDSGIHVVFFVGEFDEINFANKIFYNNLKSLWSGLYPRLHYIFLMRERVTREANIASWGELNEAILQNIVYVPLRDESDIDYLLNYYSKEYGVKLSVDQSRLLKRLFGGHPYLLKAATRFVSNNGNGKDGLKELEDELLNYYELRSVAQGILNIRSDKEKKALQLVAQGKTPDTEGKETVEFLENLKLIRKDGDKYELFGELFKQIVLGLSASDQPDFKQDGDALEINKDTGTIYMNGKTVEEEFTRQEYQILSGFLKERGKLFTRDEVGEVLWGKESYEKYSDWAIDQLISKLRKKLKRLGVKDDITTLRGRGYKLPLS